MRDVAAGATFCQSITMRSDFTPKLEISSKACVRVAGLARSTGASNVIDWSAEARASPGSAATAMSAQSARMSGAIRDMNGAGEVVARTDRPRRRLRWRANRRVTTFHASN
jgi:hypothetical protein